MQPSGTKVRGGSVLSRLLPRAEVGMDCLFGPSENNVCWHALDDLWRPGEANADQKISGVDQTRYYAAMYQSMIASWRDLKGMGDFAFMTVQLPPSVPSTEDPAKAMGTGRMQIRLAEAEASPHSGGLTDISGVAVTLDCGGKSAWGWDHPPNKNEIARRLALQTVHAAFAVQGRIPHASADCADPESSSADCSSMWTGPVFESASTSGEEVSLTFKGFSAAGLKLKDVLSTNPGKHQPWAHSFLRVRCVVCPH